MNKLNPTAPTVKTKTITNTMMTYMISTPEAQNKDEFMNNTVTKNTAVLSKKHRKAP